jgi:hypothetical protein
MRVREEEEKESARPPMIFGHRCVDRMTIRRCSVPRIKKNEKTGEKCGPFPKSAGGRSY